MLEHPGNEVACLVVYEMAMAGNHSGDLATLSELDERLILDNLNKRYEQDLIYVSICACSQQQLIVCKRAVLQKRALLVGK